ncbi:thiamine phosphate synthase [Antarcticirhabdus aurantiaca]|uniref:Thiamine phosphate synthase n=1 Tax=Antarcticirhabdus aurantiaca TaxID=2606717 RepID=A0ACD4NTM5_9HYPH|nr:thiamine phosphate synthase [Antarcticirhabdus aurantiaca]WAJ30400.1 thiamine phosphate synthase [Jeongeuplla avenae]
MSDTETIRPRLVLLMTEPGHEDAEQRLKAALSGGDVASVILAGAGLDEARFQAAAERLVPLIQEAGAAAIVADDTRCAGRVKADGIHLTAGDAEELAETVKRFSPKLIVGGSGFETRHEALDAGEALPDYLFFGRFAGDTDEAPHRKTLDMAEWWAAIVEVPCIALGGSSVESLSAVAATGAEFVALARAVFEAPDPAAAVARANAILDAAAGEGASA